MNWLIDAVQDAFDGGVVGVLMAKRSVNTGPVFQQIDLKPRIRAVFIGGRRDILF